MFCIFCAYFTPLANKKTQFCLFVLHTSIRISRFFFRIFPPHTYSFLHLSNAYFWARFGVPPAISWRGATPGPWGRALGVLVYGLLMGSVPFPAPNLLAMQQMIMSEQEVEVCRALLNPRAGFFYILVRGAQCRLVQKSPPGRYFATPRRPKRSRFSSSFFATVLFFVF